MRGGDDDPRLKELATFRTIPSTGDADKDESILQNALAFSPEGALLATAGDDGVVRVWRVPRLTKEGKLDGDVADRVKITLKLAGKSRNDITYGQNAHILKGQPFEFNIAVDSALAELFRSSQFYTNQQKLTDFVVEEVLTDRGLKISEDE